MAAENKILERAEMYLRKLSCGVNPLTEETLPEGDTCRQERISKCFLYVADYLQQIVCPKPKVTKAEKQEKPNHKVVVFTSYTDTAEYLYKHISSQFERVALVTGDIDNQTLETTLQRFAPYSKLFLELEWDNLYKVNNIDTDDYKDKLDELYPIWKKLIFNSTSLKEVKDALKKKMAELNIVYDKATKTYKYAE